MQRYKIKIEYDGAGFVGWQRQDNGPSIQQSIEDAIDRFCGERTLVYAAGRTDAGVHAFGMVAHFDLASAPPPSVICDAVNFHLKPARIAILSANQVSDAFHARFSCIRRSYVYRIINRRAPLTIDAGAVWRVPQPLDADAMNDASQILVGRHDFSTFRAVACQSSSPVKTLDEISVVRQGDEINIRCDAPSFLQHQIRSFAGTLVEVGRGKWSADDLHNALVARDRRECGPVAPACGLYFASADYPVG